MTEELVRKWSEIHGLTEKEAADDVKLWIEIYMKKAPAPTEAKEMKADTIILPQMELDENQLSLIYEEDRLHVQTL